MARSRDSSSSSVLRALDELHFGRARTLNLRQSLPSVAVAVRRVESWLREHQAQGSREVLVITGRGNNSPGGVSPVREAVVALLHSLRRRGIVAHHTEHSPGALVVAIAPLRALVEAPRRRREHRPAVAGRPTSSDIEQLDPEVRTLLRDLAIRALEGLGVLQTDRFLAAEMAKQLRAIGAAVPEGPNRVASLRRALRIALDQYE